MLDNNFCPLFGFFCLALSVHLLSKFGIFDCGVVNEIFELNNFLLIMINSNVYDLKYHISHRHSLKLSYHSSISQNGTKCVFTIKRPWKLHNQYKPT